MRKSDGTLHVLRAGRGLPPRRSGERGFARAINEQGADHHRTVTRVRAGLQALEIGIPTGYPDYVLHQMVTVMKGGEEVKISKRAGSYVTVRDLIDEVGPRRRALLLPHAPASIRSWSSTSTSPRSSRTTIRSTTSSTRTRACAACCASGAATWPRSRRRTFRALTSPHEAALAQKLARVPGAARARRGASSRRTCSRITCTTTWRLACIPTTMPSVSSSRMRH